jgi:hypothetical protein
MDEYDKVYLRRIINIKNKVMSAIKKIFDEVNLGEISITKEKEERENEDIHKQKLKAKKNDNC